MSRALGAPAEAIRFAPRLSENWERILASAPVLLLSLAFFVPVVFQGATLPGFSQRVLGRAMQVEFIVLVAGGFMILPVLAPVRSGRSARVPRAIRWIVFALFFAHFTNMAWGAFGGSGATAFAVLTLMTYGSSFLKPAGSDEATAHWVLALLRWALLIVVFLLLVGAFDLPVNSERWVHSEKVFPAGGVYFALLGILEWTGVYDWSRRGLKSLFR